MYRIRTFDLSDTGAANKPLGAGSEIDLPERDNLNNSFLGQVKQVTINKLNNANCRFSLSQLHGLLKRER